MAVAPPTPPTPPTPPSVPQVNLQEKGASTESTIPSKGSDQSPEAQAKASVAKGNGALSKTTTSSPNETPVKQSDTAAAPPQTSVSQQPSNDVQTANQVPPLMDAKDLLNNQSGEKNQSQQTASYAMTEYDNTPSSSGHSPVYWAFSILALIVLGVAVFTFLKKKSDSLSSGSLHTSNKKPKPELNLTGQTSDEVLKALQAQHSARAKANIRPQPEKENSISAAAANMYMSQSKQKPNKQKNQSPPVTEKPLTIRRNTKSDKEESHFEVRI